MIIKTCKKHGDLEEKDTFSYVCSRANKRYYKCRKCHYAVKNRLYHQHKKAGTLPKRAPQINKKLRHLNIKGVNDNPEFKAFYADYMNLRKLIKGKSLWMKKTK